MGLVMSRPVSWGRPRPEVITVDLSICTCFHSYFIVCSSVNATAEATATNVGERKLFADLFSNYVPEVRPRIDPTQTVDIAVNLDLNHIKHLVRIEPR